MSKPVLTQCEYCGSTRFDARGVCAECGNERRKPLVAAKGSVHKDWYSLEETLEKEESQAKPKPTEIPENMRVPTHPDWYDIAGTSQKIPQAPAAPMNPVTKNAVLTLSITAVLILMSIAAYLLYAMHKDLPTGFGAH